jgi:hypothetical protein
LSWAEVDVRALGVEELGGELGVEAEMVLVERTL